MIKDEAFYYGGNAITGVTPLVLLKWNAEIIFTHVHVQFEQPRSACYVM